MRNVVKSVVAAVKAFAARPAVRSAVRHAAFAGAAVLIAAISVGGVGGITSAVLVAALAAAGRALQLSIVAYIQGRKAS